MNSKETLENHSEGSCLEMFEKELDDEPTTATNWDTIVYPKWKHYTQWELCTTIQTAAHLQRKCTVLFNLA